MIIIKIKNKEQTNIQADAYLIDYDNLILLDYLKSKTVFVLFDRLLHENEDISFLLDNIAGVFFQDYKVLSLLKGKTKLFYYNLTSGTNSLEIQTLLNDVDVVFISKDIDLKDIILIQKNVSKGVAYFGTGHQTIFYSYRKLISNFLGHEDNQQYLIKESKRDNLLRIQEKNHETKIETDYIFTNLKYLKKFNNVDYFLIDLADYSNDFIIDVLKCYQGKNTYKGLIKKYSNFSDYPLLNKARIKK